MAEIAPLRIVYVFDGGSEKEIARGTITQDGMLETAKVVPSQTAAVATLVSELNGAARMFTRDVRTSPETGRAAMVKTPVDRGAPGFLEALRDTAKRFYKVDLRFDPAIFDGGELLMPGADDADVADQIDDTPPGPDMAPVENAKPGIEI